MRAIIWGIAFLLTTALALAQREGKPGDIKGEVKGEKETSRIDGGTVTAGTAIIPVKGTENDVEKGLYLRVSDGETTSTIQITSTTQEVVFRPPLKGGVFIKSLIGPEGEINAEALVVPDILSAYGKSEEQLEAVGRDPDQERVFYAREQDLEILAKIAQHEAAIRTLRLSLRGETDE